MVSIRNRFLMSAVLVAALCGVPAYAQSTEGRDQRRRARRQRRAAVPGATVTITNQATKAAQTVTTAADGAFSVSLAPGTYSVTASLKGFTHADPQGPQGRRGRRRSRRTSRSRPGARRRSRSPP